MNKAELIAAIADDAEISKAKAEFALNSAIETIIKAVTKGDSVQLIGFGTFASGKRAARMGRNPKTGSKVEVPAKHVPHFKAGKELRERVDLV